MRTYSIAAVPGDGIGSEVIAAGLEVLEAVAARDGGFRLAVETFPWGSERYLADGAMMPEDGLETLKDFDAIYFGSAGDPRVPDHVSLWGLRLAICQPFDQYANVRPSRLLPGIDGPLRGVGPDDLDWIIVRENTEGEYAGVGGRVHRGHGEEVGLDVSVFTRAGVERIQRFALELARSRPRKRLTLVTKSNAQRHGMVLKPATIDVVVATNLHADILSDLAAALSGSMGIAPTANLNPERRFPSMFEPIHGSAFDIMGRGIANPVGAFWSASMMLEHLGEAAAAATLMSAIERFAAAGRALPRDLGGGATTREVTDAILVLVEGRNA